MAELRRAAAWTWVFKMVDKTDFAMPEPSISPTTEISKDGGAFAATTNSAVEISDGWYKVLLTTTETTADVLILKADDGGTACAQTDEAFYLPTYTILEATAIDVSSPVSDDGDISIHQNVDYAGLSILTITVTGWSGVNLDGGAGKIRLLHNSKFQGDTTAADKELTCDSVAQSGSTVTITQTIAAADLATLETTPADDPDNYRSQVLVTKSSKTYMVVDSKTTLGKTIATVAA